MSGVLAGIGAGAQVLGAIGGLMNARTAANQARWQNELNLRQFLEQQRLARVQEEMAQAGTTDARGNKTEYIPGVGWVTRTSDQTRALLGASDNEERLRLTQDAARSRLRREDTFRGQQTDRLDADAARRGMGNAQRTPSELESALIARNAARATSGLEDARSRLGLVGLRTGTGSQAAFAKMARQGIDNTRTALADARAEAPSAYGAEYSGLTNPRMNQVNMLEGRARAADGDPTFQPSNLDSGLETLLRGRMAVAPQAIGSAMNVQPFKASFAEDRTPVALGSLGALLQGLGNRYGRGSSDDITGEKRGVGTVKEDGWTSW